MLVGALPALSLDRILLGVLCRFWIALGAMLEERDLTFAAVESEREEVHPAREARRGRCWDRGRR